MWTPVSQINIAQQNWQCVATNHNGTILIAAVSLEEVWVKNGQDDWISQSYMFNKKWTSVASNFYGTILVACESDGGIYMNKDGDWSNITTTNDAVKNQNWSSVALDSTGSNLFACAYGGDIWKYSTSEATWTNLTSFEPLMTQKNWQSIACSNTNNVVIACIRGGDIWISNDGNLENWYSSGIADQNWRQVDVNAEGTIFVACVSGGDIWKSYGDGYWRYSNIIQNWRSITMDASGTNIFACANENDIWTSRNSAITWTKTGMSYKNWTSIASDSTGENLIACETTIWLNTTPISGSTGSTGPTGPTGPTHFADICFVKNTLIQTDQGQVPIQQLIPGKHTLFKQYIIAVTETIHTDSYLVKVTAYAFGTYPTKDTYVSKNHKINGRDTFREAQDYVNGTTVMFVPYSREPLYNVLCERPSFMKVHGMMAETLNPQSDIALYHKSKRYRRL